MSLAARDVAWSAGGQPILRGVTLAVPPGGVLGLLGPNGSGKSSLLRLLAGLRRPEQGTVSLDGTPLPNVRRRDLARRVALVEQQAGTEADLSVAEVVRLGRTPHRGLLDAWSARDAEVCQRALAQVGLVDKAARRWHSLSGGERQRAQIARALAQEPSELLLDEPTNHLDIQHQLEILDLVRRLPATCVLAIHDLNLAALFCDRLAVLQDGRLVAEGTPAKVLTAELIQQVWGVKAQVTLDGPDARPTIRYRLG